jgi:hypothetical protein
MTGVLNWNRFRIVGRQAINKNPSQVEQAPTIGGRKGHDLSQHEYYMPSLPYQSSPC